MQLCSRGGPKILTVGIQNCSENLLIKIANICVSDREFETLFCCAQRSAHVKPRDGGSNESQSIGQPKGGDTEEQSKWGGRSSRQGFRIRDMSVWGFRRRRGDARCRSTSIKVIRDYMYRAYSSVFSDPKSYLEHWSNLEEEGERWTSPFLHSMLEYPWV